ncbi:MAG: ferrous iron transporter B [Gemmatimonadota bacterium]|nr:MAG: ferrous iron transporter B [Gemmatimonadota bacterium]
MNRAQRADDTANPGKVTVLVGNPNVGKSVLFKNLTDRYVTVSNFPGTTVEIVEARASFDGHEVAVIDTPGINDLSQRSDDARVTRELLAKHDDATIIQVADARNLRRALLLTLQLADLKRPTVLVLNMADELEERGGQIDCARLSEILGVPVVMTVAPRNQGTRQLIEALPRAQPPSGSWLAAEPVNEYVGNRARLGQVNDILAETYSMSQPESPSLKVRLGFWAMHPVKGVGFLAVALLAVFWIVGLFGAGTLVDLLETGVFRQQVAPIAIQAVDAVLPFPHTHETESIPLGVSVPLSPVHELGIVTAQREVIVPAYQEPADISLSLRQQVWRFLHDLLVGEFGTITMALSYALAIVLPIVTTFFLVFSILEDSGYFSRMAIMVNRVFRIMGLNGKAVLPMILGLGCDTMATMTTRILETRKERIITTMLLALAIPCSAQLGVLLALMAALSPAGAIFWIGLLVAVIFAVGWLTSRLFPGQTSEFILEVPPMRRPHVKNVVAKTYARLNWYLKEVIPIFVIGTAILFLLERLGFLTVIARVGEPLVTGWLGLPAEITNAFLVGFMRRDFGAVYILDAAIGADPVLSPHQILVAMVTITLFMPCFANFLMIAKEQGVRVAWRMAGFIFPFAFLVGGAVNHLGEWLNT